MQSWHCSKWEPDDAVRGALEMIRSLRWYNQGRSRAGYSSVRIGIGIHSGNVMLGDYWGALPNGELRGK